MLVLLAVATLVLLQIPDREMFESIKDPSTLTEAELSSLMDTPEGQALRTETIAKLRGDGIPDAGIPALIPGTVMEALSEAWSMYSGLNDKTQIESRLRAQFLSEDAIEDAGRSLAEATFNFTKMYFVRPDAPASRELTRAAGPPEPATLSPLSVLLQSVKDEKVREMLKNYATHMVSYQTTGQISYKTAADLSMTALKKHVADLEAKAVADEEKVTRFVDKYQTDNKDIDTLRTQLRSIRKEGPKLQDQYETQKKINESIPEVKRNYLLKLGLIVGLFVIAYLASNATGGYAVKAGVVIGLLSIGFVAYTSFLG